MTNKALVFILEAINTIDPEINLNVEHNYQYALGAIRLAKSIEVINPKLARLLEEVTAMKKKGIFDNS